MDKNPLNEFIDDELYLKLKKIGMLNERAIRDYYIRKQFRKLRTKHKPGIIIEKLRSEFPYLAVDSVRKIAYSKNGSAVTD